MAIGYKVGVDNLKVPGKSVMLLYGPPGREKLIFLLQFVYYGLQSGEPCIYITTDRSPLEIRNTMNEFGWNVAKYRDLIIFIDCYSWTTGARETKEFTVPGPSALNQLAIEISKAQAKISRPGKMTRIVFDSVSTLLLYNNPTLIYRFLQIIGARTKKNSIVFYSLEKNMHDEKIVTTIEHITDGTIEFKVEDGKYYLRSLRNEFEIGWKEFKITKNGIRLVI